MECASGMRRQAPGTVQWADQLAYETNCRSAPFRVTAPLKSILKQRPTGHVFPFADDAGKQLTWTGIPGTSGGQPIPRRPLVLVGSKRSRLATCN